MFTFAHTCSSIRSSAGNAIAGVTITFASSTNRNISHRIEIGFQYLGIAKNFVAERIQTVKCNTDISCRDPILYGKYILLF